MSTVRPEPEGEGGEASPSERPSLSPRNFRTAQGEATISVSVLCGLVEVATQASMSATEMLQAANIDPSLLGAPEARIPLSQLLRLCWLLLERSEDPAIGLLAAERMSEGLFTPVSQLVARCASLREAFELLAEFFPLIVDEATYSVVEKQDKVIVRCPYPTGQPSGIQRFYAEVKVGGLWRLVRSFSIQGYPDIASFQYPAPSYHPAYTRVFAGRERFDQPFTGLVFDRAMLNATPLMQDDHLRDALKQLAQRRMTRAWHRLPFADRVRDCLVREGSPQESDMESVARSLGLSGRSLRRHLVKENKTYSDIVSEALAVVSTALLKDPTLSLADVAYRMNFSDVSTFCRAFKRWTGTSPQAYRRSQLRT